MNAIVITEQAVQDATNEAGMQARTAAKAFLQKHGDRDHCDGRRASGVQARQCCPEQANGGG